MDQGSPFGWPGNARQDFQQRALARSIPSDDADDFSMLDVKRDVPQRPEAVLLGVCRSYGAHTSGYATSDARQRLAKRRVLRAGTEPVTFAQALRPYGNRTHCISPSISCAATRRVLHHIGKSRFHLLE